MSEPQSLIPGGRMPPCDLAAERAVLGAVFVRASTMDEISTVLATDDFLLPVHRDIYDVLLALWNGPGGRSELDAIMVIDEMRRRGLLGTMEGGETYLLKLSGSVPFWDNARKYAAIVRDKAILRRLIAICADAMTRAYDNGDVDDVLGDHRNAIAMIDSRGSDEPERVGDVLTSIIDTIEQKATAPEKYAVLIGLAEFDRKIGGYRAEQLDVVAGTPGLGKTSWALDVAFRSSVRGVPNLIFSLEMSTQELGERLIGVSENVEVRKLTRGDLDANDWRRIHNAPKRLGPLPLYVFDDVVRLDQMEAIARRWRAKFPDKVCLLTFDYLQLMTVQGSKQMNDNERFTIITRTLKLLAKSLKCPIQLVSQLNRDVVKEGTDAKPRAPKLSDLRGSGSIEQDADMVIFIAQRPGDDGGASSGPIEAPIIIGKHRGGPRGTLKNVMWDGRFSSFYPNEEAEADLLRDHRQPETDD
jgi:replicative DNA helicase